MSGGAKQTRDATERQAARHLVALVNDPDARTRAAIEDWIGADPAHAIAFAQAEAAWDAAERLKANGASHDAGDAATDHPDFFAGDQWWTRRRFVVGGVIAASAAALGLTGWLHASSSYATGVGEVRDVTLADGSALHLNTDSKVTVDYSGNRRLLRLDRGEAYFDVAHDPARPFDVQTRGGVTVRALGTAFNVRLREAVVELTVTKGVVGVATASRTMAKVAAGRGAIIQPRTVALASLDKRHIEQRTAWRDRMIELDGESVNQAIDEFNRYRSSPLVIGDQRLAPMRIGGRFRTDESDQFIAALEQSLPIRAVANGDGSVLLLYRDDDA
ncbi:FecR domain-containing protein [Sphingomonas naphthae]|uniref:FecR domain-containing protein n=1 Tax=Sphingomonas naphthae TaxID=1813468 RepID=A0ABY7TKQ5_9SPHN|nr:FecR domain-containing protein [Sphingomonas naphthae]WCT73807.1 FecR domain-containing protein [Sphingomonas naphthae]